MKTSQPNKAQTEFRELVRSIGMGEIIHHCTDRKMQIKYVGNIGHWFLNPCYTDEQHREIHAMGRGRKEYEKIRFRQVIARIGKESLPDGVYDAILAFHK